jgi:hypothetical protein
MLTFRNYIILFFCHCLFSVVPGGEVIPILQNSIVPQDTLRDIHTLMQTGWTLADCVVFLRQNLVPQGVDPHPFRKNTPESYLDKLRSLVGTYYYRHTVDDYVAQGVLFDRYLYIPEVDPITGNTYRERSDHGHLLKCIACMHPISFEIV